MVERPAGQHPLPAGAFGQGAAFVLFYRGNDETPRILATCLHTARPRAFGDAPA